MNAQDILAELESLGCASYKRVIFNHGVQEPCFGVKISELKKIQKRVKKDYQLALDLYATRNYDAQYLAGLIADDGRMTRIDLQKWAKSANGGAICGATIPSVAAGSPEGWALGLEWIDVKDDRIAATGWATLSAIVSVKPDADLDLDTLRALLDRVSNTIGKAGDYTRYHMNNFVIAAGSFVPALTKIAIGIGEKLGPISADLGDNACQVPFAPDYIQKVIDRGNLGKKRKSAKC